jgi:hypothetical protein
MGSSEKRRNGEEMRDEGSRKIRGEGMGRGGDCKEDGVDGMKIMRGGRLRRRRRGGAWEWGNVDKRFSISI